MKPETYLTWDGKEEIVVKRYNWRNNGRTISEAVVKRTFKGSDALWAAIFSQETGVFNDKTAPAMTPRERSSWVHLWDGVCCRSISPMEAWGCVKAGYVFEGLTVRASNYMHHF